MPIYAVVGMHCYSIYLKISVLKKCRHYIPSERVKKQGDILHLAASGLVQGSFFLPGAKNCSWLGKTVLKNKRLVSPSLLGDVT